MRRAPAVGATWIIKLKPEAQGWTAKVRRAYSFGEFEGWGKSAVESLRCARTYIEHVEKELP